ncbi:MAG: pyridoxamine 5'-phosphate oxidase family protein [Porticoccaceae bacterium]
MALFTLKESSKYSEAEIIAFLSTAVIPMRLACNSDKGFPLVASHWFKYQDGALYCAIHRSSLMAKLLTNDPRCGFEIAADTAPYRGVRGQGKASLLTERADENLHNLILRYLGDSQSQLAKWLLSRSDEEYLVRITPTWLTSWDFSERMTG